MEKLFNGRTTNGRSSDTGSGLLGRAVGQGGTVKVMFSGTIGGASISIDTSPDGGTTWIASGAVFATGDLAPKLLEMTPAELLSVNMTGASGTTATVWAI